MAYCHNNLGIAHDKLGDRPQALTHYEAALRFLPRFTRAITNVGNIHKDAGRLQEAARYYRDAIATNGSFAEVPRPPSTPLPSHPPPPLPLPRAAAPPDPPPHDPHTPPRHHALKHDRLALHRMALQAPPPNVEGVGPWRAFKLGVGVSIEPPG